MARLSIGILTRTFAALALALAACPPAAAQKEIQADGPYVHGPADAVFPERVGDFRRGNIRSYDEAGSDVGANYNLVTPEGRLLISVYIFPAPEISSPAGGQSKEAAKAAMCREIFAGVNQTISKQYGGAAPEEQGEALAVAGVDPGLSHRSIYRYRTLFDAREQPVRSEAHLYCYVGDRWLVKYRASTPDAVDARGHIDAFIRRGPWPGRGAAETMAGKEPLVPSGG